MAEGEDAQVAEIGRDLESRGFGLMIAEIPGREGFFAAIVRLDVTQGSGPNSWAKTKLDAARLVASLV